MDIDTIILENSDKITTFDDFVNIAGASGMEMIRERIRSYTDEEVLANITDDEAYIEEYLKDSCFWCLNENHNKWLVIYANLLYRLNS